MRTIQKKYMRPCELMELKEVNELFFNENHIGYLFMILNNDKNKILKGIRSKRGVKIEMESFLKVVKMLKENR